MGETDKNPGYFFQELGKPLEYLFYIPKSLAPHEGETFELLFTEFLECYRTENLRNVLEISFEEAKIDMVIPSIKCEEKVEVLFTCRERFVTRSWYFLQQKLGFELNDDNNFAIFVLLSYKYFLNKIKK